MPRRSVQVVETMAPFYRTSPEGHPVGERQEGTRLTAIRGNGHRDLELDLPTDNRVAVTLAAAGLWLAGHIKK